MLLEASTLLDGVTVTARRSVVENHLGKKVLRLGQELTAKGSNALEVLEMVPSVTITQQGQNILISLGDRFVRCHKSYVINIDRIERSVGNNIFIGDKRIGIGRTFWAEVMGRIWMV